MKSKRITSLIRLPPERQLYFERAARAACSISFIAPAISSVCSASGAARVLKALQTSSSTLSHFPRVPHQGHTRQTDANAVTSSTASNRFNSHRLATTTVMTLTVAFFFYCRAGATEHVQQHTKIKDCGVRGLVRTPPRKPDICTRVKH